MHPPTLPPPRIQPLKKTCFNVEMWESFAIIFIIVFQIIFFVSYHMFLSDFCKGAFQHLSYMMCHRFHPFGLGGGGRSDRKMGGSADPPNDGMPDVGSWPWIAASFASWRRRRTLDGTIQWQAVSGRERGGPVDQPVEGQGLGFSANPDGEDKRGDP